MDLRVIYEKARAAHSGQRTADRLRSRLGRSSRKGEADANGE